MTSRDHFEKCYKEAVELTAYLCKLYGINPYGKVKCGGATIPTILCHVDAYNYGVGSGHGDVMHWFPKFGKNMDDVRNDVAKLLGEVEKLADTTDKNTIAYQGHVQAYGWMPAVKNGAAAGTTGQSKRLEAIRFTNIPAGIELEAVAHVQTFGDKRYDVVTTDTIIGTTGISKRLEAITLRCKKNTTGKKLKYQAHVQTYGWQDAVSEGQMAGTKGQSKRMEAIKIWLE